jgi:Ca-activated chloride channel family protein
MEFSACRHPVTKQTPLAMKKHLSIVILLLTVAITSIAQSRIITGKVTAADDGSDMPGVNVLLKGTTTGTVANFKGEYSITVPKGNGVLVFSFIGMITQEIPLSLSSVINVSMAADVKQLSEVVVTGYNYTTHQALSGSVSGVQSSKPRKRQRQSKDTVIDYEAESYPSSQYNTEEYEGLTENGFRDATRVPLSTFSIDVDAASYSNVRRFLNNGQRPPADAVRIEEMINYFDYDYADPKDEHPFSIYTEVSTAPWAPKHQLVHIGLQGKRIPTDNLPSSNLVFLIDVSGSMADVNKLPLLKASLKMLVEQLRERDRVAIVVYAGAAGLALPSTSGFEKETIFQAIDNLEAGGSTAGGAGIQLAYKIALDNFRKDGNNRVILATDGDFNVGASSNGEMERLIEEKRNDGVFLTVLGYGMGNYKDSKMETLADKGNGNYAYIDNILEAQKVLVNEFGGTLFTIAKDVKPQIEFNPAKVKSYRLIGYENRLLKDEDFNDDKKDAGELGSGHTVTALYEVIPVGVEGETPPIDGLKYQNTSSETKESASNELMTIKFRYKKPDEDTSKLITHVVQNQSTELVNASETFRWSAAVAGFGMILRDSKYAKKYHFDDVLELARSARGEDSNGYRIELIKMVKSMQVMAKK